ncbi:MAG TPA: hypothetical protein GXZ43_05240 [Clostridiaceae bacterium]|nr:hypothetical protein [Clostridiaceae bacterium]
MELLVLLIVAFILGLVYSVYDRKETLRDISIESPLSTELARGGAIPILLEENNWVFRENNFYFEAMFYNRISKTIVSNSPTVVIEVSPKKDALGSVIRFEVTNWTDKQQKILFFTMRTVLHGSKIKSLKRKLTRVFLTNASELMKYN